MPWEAFRSSFWGTARGAVRWRERPSEAVSDALLEALRSLTSVWRCQKKVSDGRKNRVRAGEMACEAFRSSFWGTALRSLTRVCRCQTAQPYRVWGCQKAVSNIHKNRVRARHQVRWPERPSEAVSEALLEALRSLTRVWKAVSDGHKNRVRPRHQVRWPERPSEAVSEAQLEALRSLTRVWGCQKAVSDARKNRVLEALRTLTRVWRCQKAISDGHKNRVRPRHQVRWQALRSLFEGAKKQFRTFIKTECGQGTRWDSRRCAALQGFEGPKSSFGRS